MDEKILHIVIAALIGSFSTITIQYILKIIKRGQIKKSVLILLLIIEEDCDKILKEIPNTKEAVTSNEMKELESNMFPSVNSRILQTFSLQELQPVFKDNTRYIVDSIGILNNLEKRLPYIQFENYIKDSESHIERQFQEHSDLYPTKREHYEKCPEIVSLKERACRNLEHVENIVKNLKTNISKIKSS